MILTPRAKVNLTLSVLKKRPDGKQRAEELLQSYGGGRTLANMSRLIDDMAAFTEVMTKDGVLLLSGFYEADTDLLIAKAQELGLRENGRSQENGWAAISLKRQP